MWWIICIAVVIIFCFFISFLLKMRNESNEIDATMERTKTFVIMRNESNKIDVSKDLSISPSCNFQINGNGLRERKIQNLEISRTNIIIREDLQKERNKSLNKVNNIDFDIINKNKEDMNCFKKTIFRKTRFKEIMNYFGKTNRFKEDMNCFRKIGRFKADMNYFIKMGRFTNRFKEEMNCFLNRDIKLETKNMPAPEPFMPAPKPLTYQKDKKLDK